MPSSAETPSQQESFHQYSELLDAIASLTSRMRRDTLPERDYASFNIPLLPTQYIELPDTVRACLKGDGSDSLRVEFITELTDDETPVQMLRTGISFTSGATAGEILVGDQIIVNGLTTARETTLVPSSTDVPPTKLGVISTNELTSIILSTIGESYDSTNGEIDMLDVIYHQHLKEVLEKYSMHQVVSSSNTQADSRLEIGDTHFNFSPIPPEDTYLNLIGTPWKVIVKAETSLLVEIYEDDELVYRPDAETLHEIISCMNSINSSEEDVEVLTDPVKIDAIDFTREQL